MNFPTVRPSHRLQLYMHCSHGCLLWGAVPQEDCSSLRTTWVHKSCWQTCSNVSSSVHRPQVLPGACSSMGSPPGHSLLWNAPAPGWRSPWAAGGPLLHHRPPQAAGSCLTMVVMMGSRGTFSQKPRPTIAPVAPNPCHAKPSQTVLKSSRLPSSLTSQQML